MKLKYWGFSGVHIIHVASKKKVRINICTDDNDYSLNHLIIQDFTKSLYKWASVNTYLKNVSSFGTHDYIIRE